MKIMRYLDLVQGFSDLSDKELKKAIEDEEKNVLNSPNDLRLSKWR